MAQSRINKAGSIFTRLHGLIKAELIPPNEIPIWYDVYKEFPPDRDPALRSVLREKNPPLPRKIFYIEDYLRVFYEKHLSPIEPAVLNSNLTKPMSELFIEVFLDLAKKGISKENLLKASIEEMESKGFLIQIKKNSKNIVSPQAVDIDQELSQDNATTSPNKSINQTISDVLSNIIENDTISTSKSSQPEETSKN